MKKKVLMLVAIATFIVGMFVFIPKSEAKEEINPDCVNGCLNKPGWCYCFGVWPYEEAVWPS